jgi:chloramphenicol 3-O phosphotransferase
MRAGTIILLNGTSSSGKTSILKALQDIQEEPYLDVGLDKFLWMLPGRYLEPPLWDEVLGLADRAGPVGHHLVSGMHQAIAVLSLGGNNVIADHVLVEPDWLRQCIRLFSPLPAYFVGVHCPLEVLEQRERERHNRTWGQARLQYDLVHVHGIYDLEVDTSINAPEECAQQIKLRLQSEVPPHAFKRLKELQVSEDN